MQYDKHASNDYHQKFRQQNFIHTESPSLH